jgi:hypothetical protein
VDAGGRNPSTDVQNDDPDVHGSPTAVHEVHQGEAVRRELRRWRDVVNNAVELVDCGDIERALALLRDLVDDR